MFEPIAADVLAYWQAYYDAVGDAGEFIDDLIAEYRARGIVVRSGELTSYDEVHRTIVIGPNAKRWEVMEEAIHDEVHFGLGKVEIRQLTLELRRGFWRRHIRKGEPQWAAEEIFVKTTLLQRHVWDGPTRTILERQIAKLRLRGFFGGY